jgi:hypothetical protein
MLATRTPFSRQFSVRFFVIKHIQVGSFLLDEGPSVAKWPHTDLLGWKTKTDQCFTEIQHLYYFLKQG